MEKEGPTLSVITPTYNRGKLLWKCFQSLVSQTETDFEWIVVDDGSTDDTEEIMKRITDTVKEFHVTYIKKENGGKHTALNASHPYIRGKYVLILDSDDQLTVDAVEIVLQNWREYEKETGIGMLIFLKENEQHILCAYARDEYKPVDLLNYKRNSVISSDCCEVLRTDWFKKYPFPVFEGERFLAETALWYRVGLETKSIYINKVIYICQYMAGGLTKAGRSMRIRNPLGGKYTSYLRMNRRCRIEERIRAGLLFICYGCFAGDRTGKLLVEMKPYRILALLCILPGKLMYALWRKKY